MASEEADPTPDDSQLRTDATGAPTATPEHQETEPRDPTTLSIGNILSWIVGPLTILSAIGNIAEGAIAASLVLALAGIFVLPPTRQMIETELHVKMSRWFVVLGYIVLISIAGIAAV